MSGIVAQSQGSEAEFAAIEHAVMETERGRWFLREFAMRNRHADTQILLSVLSRIERTVSQRDEATDVSKFRLDIVEMSRAIARTREEISAIKPPEYGEGRLIEASDELESIVGTTEGATSEILAAAENIQEAAWTLREANVDPAACDMLDQRATEIYTACTFQDLTAQRIRKVIETLGFIETRVNAMIGIWQFESDPDPRSSEDGQGAARSVPEVPMTQADIDSVLTESHYGTAAGQLEMAHPIGQPEPSLFQREDNEDYSDVVAIDAADETISAAAPAETLAAPDDSMHDAGDEAIDEILFSPPPTVEMPERPVAADHLQLVHSSAVVDDVMVKVRIGTELSADEAARALDALKQMSVEDRTRLFS